MLSLNEYIKTLPSSAYPICRQNMPQIEDVKKFCRFLKSKDIYYKKLFGHVDHLSPTQSEFDTTKVETIIAANAFDKPIIVSDDDYVIDGHHRFFAGLETDKPLNMIVLDCDVTEALKLCYEYVES